MGLERKRFSSDVTDEQWAVIEALLPAPSRFGQPRRYPRREVVNAILYVVKNGCVWRDLPECFPPRTTVFYHFQRWIADGTMARVHDGLRGQVRAAEGRDPAPSAGIIDSQSVKAAPTVGAASRGFDMAKKVNGRKRHVIVDTLGLLLVVVVTAASVQDTAGARPALQQLAAAFPTVGLIWADGGYFGKLLTWADTRLRLAIEVVKRPQASTFTVLPRRWVVERTLAWITAHRRNARDYERLPAHSEAMICWTMIAIMSRRLAHKHH
jgi:transposase